MSRRLLALMPALILVASLGCGGKPPDTKPEPAPTTPAAPPTTPSADPNAPSAELTLTYWQEVGKLQELTARKYAALAEPKPDEVHKLLTAAAKGIDELPTEKVDPDAVTVGKGLAETLRKLAEGKADPAAFASAAGQARTTKATLSTRYYREFPALDSAAAKEPAFRIARDLGRATLAQELARLKEQIAKLDAEIKPVNDKLTEEITTKDKLQGEADSVRAILKEQTEDADLKKLRQEVLDDAVKQVEAQKKVIDKLTKEVNALRTRKGEYDRLAFEVTAVLTEGDPAETEKQPLDGLNRLRVQADRVSEKLDAQKEKEKAPPAPEPVKGK
jgi:hypothetical protein